MKTELNVVKQWFTNVFLRAVFFASCTKSLQTNILIVVKYYIDKQSSNRKKWCSIVYINVSIILSYPRLQPQFI
ncbi:hypothetical protein M23134_02355 [Microscilla marina ATCC 23134]|uniref:Uncharacterized protein n=1 Tax=Microscilla marina ATCC 23134 TaxID=313606 RepID=A1ZKD8_MICM2|nr:hypothetical protein M23134_02355 [Microscilla marina ATCC 23134]